MNDERISVAEAAKRVHKTPQYLYQLIREGKLQAEKNSKGYEISLEILFKVFPDDGEPVNSIEKNLETVVKVLENTIEELREERKEFLKQIQEKDKQIHELHTILALSQRNMESSRLALEEERKKRGFWQRLLGGRNK
jgi:septal ring factor EnvC (AmiA/AmiB activator)